MRRTHRLEVCQLMERYSTQLHWHYQPVASSQIQLKIDANYLRFKFYTRSGKIKQDSREVVTIKLEDKVLIRDQSLKTFMGIKSRMAIISLAIVQQIWAHVAILQTHFANDPNKIWQLAMAMKQNCRNGHRCPAGYDICRCGTFGFYSKVKVCQKYELDRCKIQPVKSFLAIYSRKEASFLMNSFVII